MRLHDTNAAVADRVIAGTCPSGGRARYSLSDRLAVRVAACVLLFGGLAALLSWAFGLIARL